MSPAAGPQERCLSKSICSAISLLMQRLKPRGVLVEAQGLLPHDQKLSLGTCKISLSVGCNPHWLSVGVCIYTRTEIVVSSHFKHPSLSVDCKYVT